MIWFLPGVDTAGNQGERTTLVATPNQNNYFYSPPQLTSLFADVIYHMVLEPRDLRPTNQMLNSAFPAL